MLDVRDYPQFDPTVGMLNVEETHEEVEIELNEAEPIFLRGQTKNSIAMSPIKIVKNPDGGGWVRVAVRVGLGFGLEHRDNHPEPNPNPNPNSDPNPDQARCSGRR